MPIHVPPLSRRQFLGGSLAAGAAVLWPDWLPAEEAAVDPNRFALLADTHVWQHRDREHNGVRPAENFALAQKEIVSLSPRPAAAIIAGDCAFNEGNDADYAVLMDVVRPIRQAGIPLHFVLGNHDNRENFYEACPEARPAGKPTVAEKHVAVLETPHANFFLLDSLQKSNYTPGRLGAAQLDWLSRALDARPDKPALVVAHHNLDRNPKTSGLQDTTALLDVLAPRKQVKAYLFGHSHRWQQGAEGGIHLINIPTLVWIFDKTQPRGWVDARLRPDGVALTLNALDKSHSANGQTVDLKWRAS